MKFRLGPAKPKHPWSLWWWTSATENLFDLTPEELYTFKLLTEQATQKAG